MYVQFTFCIQLLVLSFYRNKSKLKIINWKGDYDSRGLFSLNNFFERLEPVECFGKFLKKFLVKSFVNKVRGLLLHLEKTPSLKTHEHLEGAFRNSSDNNFLSIAWQYVPQLQIVEV